MAEALTEYEVACAAQRRFIREHAIGLGLFETVKDIVDSRVPKRRQPKQKHRPQELRRSARQAVQSIPAVSTSMAEDERPQGRERELTEKLMAPPLDGLGVSKLEVSRNWDHLSVRPAC